MENSDSEDEHINTENIDTKSSTKCCTKKCLSKFDDAFKSHLKTFLSKLTKLENRIYLFGMISIDQERQNNIKSIKIFRYSVKEYESLRFVCKSAFIELHDTTPNTVRTLCDKMVAKQLIPFIGGKHNRNAAIPEQTIELIEAHFYATLESPTIFKCARGNLGQPNLTQLWTDFNQRYAELGFRVARHTYCKYIQSFFTPEVLSKFMNANYANQLFQSLKA